MRAKTAFTLIELLVVIAIISIIAAILFPVFSSAREKARQTTCLSNEKEIGLGMVQYTQDYDECLPGGNYLYGGSVGWAGEVYSYVKSANIFRCPDDPDTNIYNYSSYAINENLTNHLGTGNNVGLNVTKMNAPALTVLLFEVQGSAPSSSGQGVSSPQETSSPAGFGEGMYNGYDPSGAGSAYSGGTCTGTLKYATGDMGNRGSVANANFENGNPCLAAATGRHNGGSNFLMCDGHAKFLSGTKVSTGEVEPTESLPSQETTANSPEDSEFPNTCNTGSAQYACQPAGTNNLTMYGAQATVTFSYL